MVYDVNKDKEEKAYGVPYATNASGVIYNVTNSKNMELRFQKHGMNSLMCSRNFRMQVNSHFL